MGVMPTTPKSSSQYSNIISNGMESQYENYSEKTFKKQYKSYKSHHGRRSWNDDYYNGYYDYNYYDESYYGHGSYMSKPSKNQRRFKNTKNDSRNSINPKQVK